MSKPETPTLHYARQAFAFMMEKGIEPTPVNYTIWYHYIAHDKKELHAELDQLLKKKQLRITDDVHIYLYNKYVMSPSGKDEAQQTQVAGENAQEVLAEIMQVIDTFSGHTETYNQEIDEQVTQLSNKITDPALKEMARELVSRAVKIRDSGAQLNTKLEDSRREVVQLKTTLDKVMTESSKDFLTGTANRKSFEMKLEELTTAAKTHSTDLCLLMIDIDYFKKFNDKHGHLIGDEILRKVGQALFESVKGKDVVARYGGEEFAILLPGTPLANGLIVAENVRKSIAETELVRKDTGAPVGAVTISIGVARYRPISDSPAMFISRADSALYRSKMGGRNRVTPESFES